MGANEETLKRPKPASVLESLGALGEGQEPTNSC